MKASVVAVLALQVPSICFYAPKHTQIYLASISPARRNVFVGIKNTKTLIEAYLTVLEMAQTIYA